VPRPSTANRVKACTSTLAPRTMRIAPRNCYARPYNKGCATCQCVIRHGT
jgi:hypothetical protein